MIRAERVEANKMGKKLLICLEGKINHGPLLFLPVTPSSQYRILEGLSELTWALQGPFNHTLHLEVQQRYRDTVRCVMLGNKVQVSRFKNN